MKKSKQANTSDLEDGVDMISSLPDPILHLILSGIPSTEGVVRTSILSRRWRHMWTSVPSLDINYSRGLNPGEKYKRNKVKEYKFTEFVYWVLLTRSLDLDSFRLSCSYYYSMSTVGRWIHAAVTRNVKQLRLSFRPGHEDIEMPHCLVTCGSLEVLRLFSLKGRLGLPKFTGFPSLRVLELKGVTIFDDDLAEAFFKSLTLLEDLSFIDCIVDRLEFLCISCPKLKNLRIDNREMVESRDYLVYGDLLISCPKLVFFELIGSIAYKIFFDSLDSLKEAVIHPKVYYPDSDSEPELEPERERMDGTLCEPFAGISHVESLSISMTFAAKCIDQEVDFAVSLPNLKTLELTIDSTQSKALQFIKCFPNLESLHLNIESDYMMLENWKLDDDATMRILTRKLKKVHYLYFNGQYRQVASFFLEHGKSLEEMVFIESDEAEFPKWSKEIMKEVSSFHKASSTVKLITLLKKWPNEFYHNLSSKV